MDFQSWHKIARLNRDIEITEKIDGTNAQVTFMPLDNTLISAIPPGCSYVLNTLFGDIGMWVGSRKRWITPGKRTDNFGFAAWAVQHATDLHEMLGDGHHYGEWYGVGIQRGYGLAERRLALFNTDLHETTDRFHESGRLLNVEPVPVLYSGLFSATAITETVDSLRGWGSVAVQGYDQPEGIVIYHKAARMSFKVTLEDDAQPKSFTKGDIDKAAIVLDIPIPTADNIMAAA